MHTKSGRSTAGGRRAIATALFAVSVASIALSSLEVFAQGPMSPGGGAMAPQPRVAPPPPPPPPPPVMAPVSPGTQPGSPASVAPRSTTKNSDNDSPTPQDRSTTTGGGTDSRRRGSGRGDHAVASPSPETHRRRPRDSIASPPVLPERTLGSNGLVMPCSPVRRDRRPRYALDLSRGDGFDVASLLREGLRGGGPPGDGDSQR